jgi:4-hydroxy-4-methyl-2-oxoglutarate aldolase
MNGEHMTKPIALLDDEIVAFLRSVDSPTIANAVEQLGMRDRTVGFLSGHARCFFPEFGVTVGRAFTVTMTNVAGSPGDGARLWDMWQTLESLPGPSLLVVKDLSGSPARVAYCGEVMATLALKLGAVGMVTDGGVRDLQEVEALGFQYFAPFPVVSHGNFEVVSVGDPVTLFGETIEPAAILHGDRNGVVVLPDCHFEDLREAVDVVRTSEARLVEHIRSDSSSVSSARSLSGY